MPGLHPAVASWFAERFAAPTEAQALAVPRILAGEHVLVSSPTGSGKTLAAFLGVLSRLLDERDAGTLERATVRCVYVSPLKALASDMAKNLAEPLRGIGAQEVKVALRHGETSRAERERQAREAPHILVTTPESLALLLASPRWRAPFHGLRHVIVDEVHAIAESKRGAHLVLSLERLEARAATPPQRIGLSATLRPLSEAAAFLTGGRPCAIVESRPKGPCQIRVGMPVEWPLHAPERALREGLFARLRHEMDRGETTLVFANTRKNVEELVRELGGDDGDEDADGSSDPAFGPEERFSDVAPHHGSMSREERFVVEERMRRGELRCVVATSSIELGVHVDSADQVVLLGSPKSAARALQRVGRSGHAVGREARGLLLASAPDELLEGVAVASLAYARTIEELRVPPGGLDVLAQHLVALALDGPRPSDEAFALTRRAWPYRDLDRAEFDRVLDHLQEIDLVDFALRPHGRARQRLTMGGGAIARERRIKVLASRRFVGDVEAEFASGLEENDVFRLAGATWRFKSYDGLVCRVEPARNREPTVPDWHAEGMAATPLVLATSVGILRGDLLPSTLPPTLYDDAATLARLDEFLALQREAVGAMRANEALVELVPHGTRRALILHAPLGRKATEALSRALAPRIDEFASRISAEWGCAWTFPRSSRVTLAALRRAFDAPLAETFDLFEDDLFERRFRHVAERALAIVEDPERPPGHVARDARKLLARLPGDHVLVREAVREVLHDALDLDGAEAFRRLVAEGRVELRMSPRHDVASPLGSCIVHPRTSELVPSDRLAALRDDFELSGMSAPRPRGGFQNGKRAAKRSKEARPSST